MKIEISEPAEDDAFYLAAMKEGENSQVLTKQEKEDFIDSLKGR